jgi:Cof subfamily protein (haloacid dehalogenase superfamily)
MPIRLLAIDLDGTLLNSESKLSPANREALTAAAERGVAVLIVTGRRFHSARPLVVGLPFPVTVISSNGARIGTLSGDVFHRSFLPAPVARQVLEVARGYRPYAVAIFDQAARGQVMMERCATREGPLGWYLKNNPDGLLQVPDLPAAVRSDPIQIMFGGRPETIEPIEPLLSASSTAAAVHLTWTKYLDRDTSILDVMNRGCSKGAALKRWAERCGVDPSEVMAIGDNYNDLEMLEFAGHPVLMGNSTAGLARADWFVTASNDQDGVARAVEGFVLKGRR